MGGMGRWIVLFWDFFEVWLLNKFDSFILVGCRNKE